MSLRKGLKQTVTAIAAAPVTVERPVFQDWDKVQNAGVARANVAVTEDAPKGTTHDDYARKNAHRTVLHQHINFFDLSSTGIISPWDTYTAFRLLQWHILLALLATFVIHTGFSYPSLPPGHWLPDPLFRIRAAGIHQCKHGGDSGAYDNEGRYRAQQLADFFSKYGDRVPRRDGREGEDDGEYGMTYAQALHGARSQRCLFDFFGTFAALFEWTATYITIWPADGIMRMEDVRGVYDGSYFFKVAGDRRARYLSQSRTR